MSCEEYFKRFFEKSPEKFLGGTEKMKLAFDFPFKRALLFCWRVLVVALVNAVMLLLLLRAPL